MIKQGIINFFKNLKYFFTPLGTLALGLVFGLSILIPGTLASFSTLADDVQKVLSDTTIDFTALKNSVLTAVQALDWSNPINALKTMLSNDWLLQTLNSCISSLVDSSEVYTAQITTAINSFVHDIHTYFTAVTIFLALGLIGGFYLTRWLIRRNMAKRKLWKYFLHVLIDSLLTATLVALCLWLLSVWNPSIFISSLITIMLFGFISLFEAYIVHAWKKVDVKQILNAKNIFALYLTNVIIFIIAAVGILLVILLTNIIVGIFIGVAVMEIALIVIGLNAEAYVKSVAEDKSAENTVTAESPQSAMPIQ